MTLTSIMTPVQHILGWMTPSNISFALLTCIALQVFHQIIYYYFFHPLSIFPGPFWGRVTRLWVAYQNFTKKELESYYHLHNKYGPVIRITPSMLLVNDSTKLPEIYHRSADKSDHYVTGGFGNAESVLNMKEHKTHAKFRKLIAGPYSFTNVKKLEYLIDARTQNWIDRLAAFARTEEKFDFAPWTVYMAYDVISEIGFGAPIGFVEAGHDVGGLIDNFHKGLILQTILGRLHPFMTLIKKTWLGSYFIAKPEDNSGIGVLMRLRDRLLTQRIKDIEEGKTSCRVDLLQTFLEARTDDDKPLDVEYIKAEILLVLLAGSDTTGTSFQGMVVQILQHPHIYHRMMEEIDDATRRGLLSPMPQFDEVTEHCPYYIACLREVNRLWPSATGILPRLVAEPGIDLYGKFVPPGTEITCNPWVIHREKKLYGDDADVFRPERWLDTSDAKLFLKYNFTFGYGTRICLGKDIALVELYKGPLQFFRRFTPTLVDKKNPPKWVPVGGVAHWKDINMTIKERTPVAEPR